MKKLFIILTVLILAGCGTTKEIIPAVQTKNVLIAPPDELLQKCEVIAPPARDLYINSTWQEKEELLIVFSTQEMKSLFKCNKMITSLQEWKKKQIEIYSK